MREAQRTCHHLKLMTGAVNRFLKKYMTEKTKLKTS